MQRRWKRANKILSQRNLDHCYKPRQIRRKSTTRGRSESGSAIHTSHIDHRYHHHRLTGDSVRVKDRIWDGATVHRHKCQSFPVVMHHEVLFEKEETSTCHPLRQVRTLYRCCAATIVGIQGKCTFIKQVYPKLDGCIAHC